MIQNCASLSFGHPLKRRPSVLPLELDNEKLLFDMTNTLGYSIILYFSLINKQLVYLAGLFQKNSYGITPELFSEFVVRTKNAHNKMTAPAIIIFCSFFLLNAITISGSNNMRKMLKNDAA